MPTSGSVTHWLQQLGDGDAAAAQLLWERYYEQLVRLADRKLRGTPRGAADEEDVALSAFDCFCRAAARGRFPDLRDRQGLWRLLVVITARKALNLARREQQTVHLSDLAPTGANRPGPADSSLTDGLMERIVGREPTPAFIALVAEEYHLLLDRLPDDEFRQIAEWKLEGYTNAEIAAKIGCSKPTVERRLNRIRKVWAKEKSDDRNSSND